MSSRMLMPSEISAAAEVMAEAYVEDPLCAFILPLRRTRKQSLVKFFRAYFSVSVNSAQVIVTGQPICGVAIWNPPGTGSVSVSLKKFHVFLPLLGTLYPIGLVRARPAMRAQSALRSQWAPSLHYYLDNVGVSPSRRGEGIASQLILPALAEADARGTATYTDTFTSANVPLYEHFGFRCVAEVSEPRTGLTIWALLRSARM